MGAALRPFREVRGLDPGVRAIRRGRGLRVVVASPADPVEQDLDLVPVGEIPLVSLGGWQVVRWLPWGFWQPGRVGVGHLHLWG